MSLHLFERIFFFLDEILKFHGSTSFQIIPPREKSKFGRTKIGQDVKLGGAK